MNTLKASVGRRIRYHRERQQRTQAAVAGLCGITTEYLSLIERGRKVPSLEVLGCLAAELGVSMAVLLDGPLEVAPAPADSADPDIARAFLRPGKPRATEPAAPAALRERVEGAWRIWQTSPERFTEITALLPSLMRDIDHAVSARRHSADGAARRETQRIAADLYGLVRSYCRRTGRLDLSLLAAERAVRAAQDADDPVRIAAGEWNWCHVLLSQDRPAAADEADEIAAQAVHRLHQAPAGPEALALAGALELVRVLAAARRRHWSRARQYLEEHAVPLGRRVGEGNVAHTVFGPTNCQLHALSIEMLAGDAVKGLRVADAIDTSALPSRERQFTFGLELARCYDLRREDPAVLVHLLQLEALAPEDLQRTPLARSLVTGLLHRVRPLYRPQVTGLAERLSLI